MTPSLRKLHDVGFGMTCQATSSKLREVLRSDTIGVLASMRWVGVEDRGPTTDGYDLDPFRSPFGRGSHNPTGFGDLFTAMVKYTTYPSPGMILQVGWVFLAMRLVGAVVRSLVCAPFVFGAEDLRGKMMIPNLEKIKQKTPTSIWVFQT